MNSMERQSKIKKHTYEEENGEEKEEEEEKDKEQAGHPPL